MKLIGLAVVVLVVVLVVFSLTHSPTTAQNGVAGSNSRSSAHDAVRESDDPATVVTNAEQALLTVTQPYRCSFVLSSSDAAPDSNMEVTEQVAARDLFRIATHYTLRSEAGASIPDEEVVHTPTAIYSGKQGEPWKRTQRGPWSQEPDEPVLLEGSGLKYGPGQLTPRLKLVETQELQGIGVAHYVLAPGEPTDQLQALEYWIRLKDGLPYRTESTRLGGRGEVQLKMTTACSFEPVEITPPL